jgi:hypothetical protein
MRCACKRLVEINSNKTHITLFFVIIIMKRFIRQAALPKVRTSHALVALNFYHYSNGKGLYLAAN